MADKKDEKEKAGKPFKNTVRDAKETKVTGTKPGPEPSTKVKEEKKDADK